MKKLTFLALFLFALGTVTKANSYKLDDQQLEKTFEKSQEISFEEMYSMQQNNMDFNSVNIQRAESKTRGGYLVRAFFCGGFALHRYYMGLNESKGWMWAFYFCVPVAGGVDACVDFWWVVFDEDALSKYENNDDIFVWLD